MTLLITLGLIALFLEMKTKYKKTSYYLWGAFFALSSYDIVTTDGWGRLFLLIGIGLMLSIVWTIVSIYFEKDEKEL